MSDPPAPASPQEAHRVDAVYALADLEQYEGRVSGLNLADFGAAAQLLSTLDGDIIDIGIDRQQVPLVPKDHDLCLSGVTGYGGDRPVGCSTDRGTR